MKAEEARDLLNKTIDESLEDVFQCIKEAVVRMETEWICTFNLTDFQIIRLRELGYQIESSQNIEEKTIYIITWD